MYPAILTKVRRLTKDSTSNSPFSGTAQQQRAKSSKIEGRHSIWSVAFLVDGKHVVGGGDEQKIRRWRVEDGKDMGMLMDAGSAIFTIAVSRDGKWVVGGMISGWVMVWSAESDKKVAEFKVHSKRVCAVDVSPDATKFTTGSEDKTACVRSLSTGKRLFDRLEHDNSVVAAKFSPDGRLVATATLEHYSIRIYDSETGHLFVDVPIHVDSAFNQSLAWAGDSKQLLALSHDGTINCLDVSTGSTLFRWSIHSSDYPGCIALASNGRFIAASANSSVSFWDPATHEQIGEVIQDDRFVRSMAISSNSLATGGDKTITLRSLCDVLPSPYCDDSDPSLERGPTVRADNGNSANSEATVRTLREELATIQREANLEKDRLNDIIDSLRAERRKLKDKNAHLEYTVQELRTELAESQHKADTFRHLLRAHEQKHQCETLYTEGRIIDAGTSLLEITNAVSEDVRANKLFVDWFPEFTSRCVSTLEVIGDEAFNSEKHDEALAAYSIALSLSPQTPNVILVKWASVMSIRGSAIEAVGAAAEFRLPKFVIYREICEVLYEKGRVTEAIECFRQMQSKLGQDRSIHGERLQWELDFRRRCTGKLEKLGDIAMDARSYGEATEYFSIVLSLDPMNRMSVLIKRGKARVFMNLWEEALSDADEVVILDASCYRGYEVRHAALHGARRYAEAAEAFHEMLVKIEESPYEHIRECRHHYVDATPTIRHIVKQTIYHMPRVLIDTATGRLYDKKQQAAAFEALPIYSELVSSMTKELDSARIWTTVKEFYRYVMLSHKWEDDEPLLQKVEHISVYELESSPANIKLQTFCSLVRSLGFRWAWSDTCCVDKLSNTVLQESLVAMFTWYHGSSLTVVYLRGVSSGSRAAGGLKESIWNTRAWTYQEYVAAETVQFYTEDWKPYLGLTLSNHKESPDIIMEMQATKSSVKDIAILRPGLDRAREKLYLASTRQTTLMEDMAYSLLGIFSAAIPVIYGEGNRAIGRLLEHILTGSGDVTILAWTGRSGSYNSCLPTDLTVYDQLVPSHVPQPIETAEMDSMVMALRSSLPDLSLAVKIYNRLNKLPSPSLTATRLQLPGINFPLTGLVRTSEPDPVTNLRIYHAKTSAFGDVEIRTTDNLTGKEGLCLVHPWIRPLLDQEFSHGVTALDSATQALRFLARLRQPFGALLFEPVSSVKHKRVAADSLIMVQLREEILLTDFTSNIRLIGVQ